MSARIKLKQCDMVAMADMAVIVVTRKHTGSREGNKRRLQTQISSAQYIWFEDEAW
jgi:hypothetical protein